MFAEKCIAPPVYPYAIFYVISFNLPLIAFGLLGTSLNLFMTKQISLMELFALLFAGFVGFVVGIKGGVLAPNSKSILVSYSLGFCIFVLYACFKKRPSGNIVKYASEISYSFYAVQGSCYMIMSFLDWKLKLGVCLNILLTLLILIIMAEIVNTCIKRITYVMHNNKGIPDSKNVCS